MKKLEGGWRVVGAVLLVVGFAAMSCGEEGGPRVAALVGGAVWAGLGEERWAPYAETRVELGGWRAAAQGELSRKVETRAGYRLGLDLERRVAGPVVVLAAYRERSAGAWRKRGAWVGGGVGWREVQLRVRQELGGNQTRSASLTVALGVLELQGSGYHYRPTFGGPRAFGGTVLVGARVGR